MRFEKIWNKIPKTTNKKWTIDYNENLRTSIFIGYFNQSLKKTKIILSMLIYMSLLLLINKKLECLFLYNHLPFLTFKSQEQNLIVNYYADMILLKSSDWKKIYSKLFINFVRIFFTCWAKIALEIWMKVF